ncbi:MAG: winged helix-turn-helix transcriptional regulator [Prevotella sp.]|nr:winged helix-turn-helix transcriptional regulator [Prevotella sp.]
MGVKLDLSTKSKALILAYLADNQNIEGLNAAIDDISTKLGVKLGVNAKNSGRGMSNRILILLLLVVNPNITRKELSSLMAVSLTTIDNHLTWLRQNGIITREGSDKSGRWTIND